MEEAFGFGENVADHALTPAEKRWKDKQTKIQEKLERKKNSGKTKNAIEKSRNPDKYIIKAGKDKLNKEEFLKIAEIIRKRHGFNLHWIDRNTEEFQALYRAWYEKPKYSFLQRKE